MILSSGANHDPKIFKEPHVFKPGRENAERLLSWNNVAWHSHSSFSLVSLTAKGLFGSVGSWAVVFQWFSRGGEARSGGTSSRAPRWPAARPPPGAVPAPSCRCTSPKRRRGPPRFRWAQ